MTEIDKLSWRLAEMASLNEILAKANNRNVEVLLRPRQDHIKSLFFGEVIRDALIAVYGE
jgi:hypothetical protein